MHEICALSDKNWKGSICTFGKNLSAALIKLKSSEAGSVWDLMYLFSGKKQSLHFAHSSGWQRREHVAFAIALPCPCESDLPFCGNSHLELANQRLGPFCRNHFLMTKEQANWIDNLFVEFCKGARQSGLMSVWQHTLGGQQLQGFL